MVKVQLKDKNFYMDGYLKDNLDWAKKSVKAKWDMVFTISGGEGTAKSTLAKMIGYYLSEGKFNTKNIVFTTEDFVKAVKKAKPMTCIVFDEFITGGMSGDAITKNQKTLVKLMTLIRKKQLFICLVIPQIFSMSKFFIMHRTKFLIHCYTPDWIQRGFFRFYNFNQKNWLYIKGIKYWTYPKDCSYSFEGKFTDYTGMFVNEKIYEENKDKAIHSLFEEDKKDENIILTKARARAVYGLGNCHAKVSSDYRVIGRLRDSIRLKFPEIAVEDI